MSDDSTRDDNAPAPAWEYIEDYWLYWMPFEARFLFRPGVDPATWPAIREPLPSMTIDLTPVSDDDSGCRSDALDRLTLDAMLEAFPTDTRLVALNWNHSNYWFWPHRFDPDRER